jgi:hypothetical protein
MKGEGLKISVVGGERAGGKGGPPLSRYRTACGYLAPVAAGIVDCEFRTDLMNLCKIAVVQDAPDTDLEDIYNTKKEMVAGATALKSRFSRALIAFGVGREIQANIDYERASFKQLEGVTLDLKELQKQVSDWPSSLVEVSQVGEVSFSKEAIEKVPPCWGTWGMLKDKFNARVKAKLSHETKELEINILKPYNEFTAVVKTNFQTKLADGFATCSELLKKSSWSTSDTQTMVKTFEDIASISLPSLETAKLR